MKLLDSKKDLFQILSDQLLISSGSANDLREVLKMAQQSPAWSNLTVITKDNFSFQVEEICKFIAELDNHADRIHTEGYPVDTTKKLSYG